jgi:hypothetical protein
MKQLIVMLGGGFVALQFLAVMVVMTLVARAKPYSAVGLDAIHPHEPR